MKHAQLLCLVAIIGVFVPTFSFADHGGFVSGKVIDLADASLSHGENCDDLHYHGELDGVADPDPNGCGHGIVTILAHDENDESIVPEEETEEDDTPGIFSKIGGVLGDVFDVVAQMFGAPPPKTIYESVEITEEAAPSIKENIDNIDEYRESTDEEDTLGIYRDPSDGLEEGSLSQRFFSWFNSLTD